jgi:hypothetical protein
MLSEPVVERGALHCASWRWCLTHIDRGKTALVLVAVHGPNLTTLLFLEVTDRRPRSRGCGYARIEKELDL